MKNKFGKLRTLSVQGYKSIRSIERLPLRDLNIVIGQNGAGKSNFVSLFRFLSRLARAELQNYVAQQGGINKILHFGAKIMNQMNIHLGFPGSEYWAGLKATNDGTLLILNEREKSENSESGSVRANVTESRLLIPTHAFTNKAYLLGTIES